MQLSFFLKKCRCASKELVRSLPVSSRALSLLTVFSVLSGVHSLPVSSRSLSLLPVFCFARCFARCAFAPCFISHIEFADSVLSALYQL